MRNLPNPAPKCVVLIGLLSVWLSPSAATTKVYQYQNSAGETVFTDEPVEGATIHEVESAPVIPMEPVAPAEVLTANDLHQPEAGQQPAAPSGSPPAELAETGVEYDHFQVIEPADGEVANRPSGTIVIELALQPALQPGDQLRVLIDGQPYVKDSTGRRHLVNGLSPGGHVITAQILRDGQVVRQAAEVRFQLVMSAQ